MRTFAILLVLLTGLAMADMIVSVDTRALTPITSQLSAQANVLVNIRALPDWQSLTNARADYATDKGDYTNKVAQISDAPTKQAVRALATMVQDLQQQISDLKRVVLALSYQTTTNTVIGQ